MAGFSENSAWDKACTPIKGSNTGSFSERLSWDGACIPDLSGKVPDNHIDDNLIE